MKEFLKTHKYLFAIILAYALVAEAASLKSWVAGESINSSDLNSNFTIVNNRVLAARAVAAQALTEAQTIPGRAKAYGLVGQFGAACSSAGACTVYNAYNTTSVVRNATAGDYTITTPFVFPARSIALITPAQTDRVCAAIVLGGGSGTTLNVSCTNLASVAADSAFIYSILGP